MITAVQNKKIIDVYSHYLAHQYEAQLAPATLENTADCVGRFVAKCGGRPLAAIDGQIVHDHFIHLRDDCELANATLAKHKTAVRAFFNWCVANGHIQTNPADVLKRNEHSYTFKPVTALPAPASTVAAILAALDDFAGRGGFNDVRDAALVSLAIDSGSRRGELRTLRRHGVAKALAAGRWLPDAGRTAFTAVAMGKTGEARIRFYDETAVLLWRLLDILPAVGAYLFISSRTGKLLHPDSMRDSFRRVCEFAGVPMVSFQAIRKRTVRDAIRITGDAKAGQLMAGHRDIRTTQLHYNLIDDEDAAAIGAAVANAKRGRPAAAPLAAGFFGAVE